jgi:CRISPR-associated Csx2 family protein
MHKLILILGTGQGVLEKHLEQKYRTADYYFEEEPDKVYASPFIGEAIITAKSGEFDEVFILGTINSMWETLYDRAIGENASEEEIETFYSLADKIKNLTLSNDELKPVENKLTEIYKIKTNCKIISVGKSGKERWKIFEDIIGIPDYGDKVSIDITHGLRYQPYILTLSLFYLQASKDISVENVYYGALELSKSYYNGKTPIMNLVSLVRMIKWVNSAFSFNRYGDSSVFAEVINPETNKNFIKRAEYFSNVLQLNTVKMIKANAEKFLKALNEINLHESELEAFKLVEDKIKEFPTEVKNAKTNYEIMILLAEKHWTNNQYGLSILSAWEAIMEKLADVYAADIRNNFNNYRRISQISKNKNAFGDIAKKINNFRNAIAHAETEKSADPNKIIADFPYWFNELKNKIEEDMSDLPHKIKLNIDYK